ncbi:FUSC family protein [Aureimonas sp. AU4]|uniref:FUSC family protein n=1 Tax=Aureimonas sp. AU4 TaxID=1638163 RepID=UPI000786467F|nr:FUSC family protein [Aureimonas sp. AU4]
MTDPQPARPPLFDAQPGGSVERRAGPLARLLRRLEDADPALIRLRLGLRVTLTLALVALALLVSHRFVALPQVAYAVALALALQGAVAIKDTTVSQRVRTRLWSALVGMAALTSASLLAGVPLLRDLLFLAVAFAAVLARRWGPRWNAAGMFGFNAYFMAAYFAPAPGDLPAIALALILCVIVAHWVRDRALPDRPADDLRRTLRVVDGRVGRVASRLRQGLKNDWPDGARDAVLQAEQRVRDGLLIAEGLLPATEGGGTAPLSAPMQASIQLFDLHLALETAIGAAFEARRDDDRVFRSSLERLARLRLQVRRTVANLTDEMLDPAVAVPSQAGPLAWSNLAGDPFVRTAFQVTLACAIAMAGGYLLSEQRWFWAVLTAFLVFVNTQSRGDALLRGLDRSLGTAGGVVLGIGLATLLHGSFALSLALIAACVFLGFYLLQTSYGALSFFVTVALSLIYGLLGNFSPELLLLRLEETLIGAASGMFVSFFVLPRPTLDAVRKAVDGFLSELDRLIEAFGEMRRGNASSWRLVAVTRSLDRRHSEIAAAVRPLESGWLAGARRRDFEVGLLRFTVLSYWAHLLAGSQGDGPQGLDAALEACRDEIRAARGQPERFFERAQPASLRAPRESQGPSTEGDPALALHAIRHVLAQLGGARDGSRRSASTGQGASDKEPAVPGPVST